MWNHDFADLAYELERYGYFPIADKDIVKIGEAKFKLKLFLEGKADKEIVEEALRILEEVDV